MSADATQFSAGLEGRYRVDRELGAGGAVERGFHPHDGIVQHCPFLAPLRGTAGFDRIAARAARRVAEFRA